MRLMLIHQAFVSPSQPGGTRHFELASRLVSKGDEALVICSDISYLTGASLHGERPRFASWTTERGIRICRVRTYAGYHKSYVHRLASFWGFTLSSLLVALRGPCPDVVVGTSPPPFQAIAAYLAARWHGVPFVFEIRDLFWDYIAETQGNRGGIVARLGRRLEQALCRSAAMVIVNSPGFVPHVKQSGVSEDRIVLVANGVDTEMFSPAAADRTAWRAFGCEDAFIVLYAGALGMLNDIPTLISAASLLEDIPSLRLCLMGDGKEKRHLMELVEASGQKNVLFIPAQPKSVVPALVGSADVCVASLRNLPILGTVYPNKVFDYLAAARPVVLAIAGEIKKVVEAARAGVSVEPGDPQALAAAIRSMYLDRSEANARGARGRAYVLEHFERSQQAERFADALSRASQRGALTRASHRHVYGTLGKRLFDVVAGLFLLVVATPLIVVIALLVRIVLGTPVFFVQDRPGLRGRVFRLIKFRSMQTAREKGGRRLSDAERLGRFGRLLRRTSLDELPELLNVIRGDMSLVGPRPLLVEYLERYTPEQARRHEVRPGLTGWAEVNGRNALSWEARFALDVWYVDHMTFALDMKILLRTMLAIVTGKGVTEPGSATKTEFRGSGMAETTARNRG